MLPYLNGKGLNLVETEFHYYLKLLKDSGEAADVLWYDIVKVLLFRHEAKQIKATLDKADIESAAKESILEFLKTHPCQFGLQTV